MTGQTDQTSNAQDSAPAADAIDPDQTHLHQPDPSHAKDMAPFSDPKSK
jgi:hypothetical protein